jgi:hypothetical protein
MKSLKAQNSVTDFAHKMLSPSTYECQLCALTYGSFSMKQKWKSFIESLPIKTVFFIKMNLKSSIKFKLLFQQFTLPRTQQ